MLAQQSPEQRAQVRRVADLDGSGGTLDYVAPWFIRASDCVRRAQPPDGGRPPRIGFVATNSITQGEQVAQLWPLLLGHRRLEIAFPHRTFAWGSDARGKAHVHVVIIGLDAADHAPRDRRLFANEDIDGEPLECRHAAITPYLLDGGALADPHVVVQKEGRPINGMGKLVEWHAAHRRRLLHLRCGGASLVPRSRASRRAVPSSVRRCPRGTCKAASVGYSPCSRRHQPH